VLFLACEKKEENGESYMGILHILRGGGRQCGDIAHVVILHIFSESTHLLGTSYKTPYRGLPFYAYATCSGGSVGGLG